MRSHYDPDMVLAMKALIIQHTETSPPGSSIDWLEARNISYTIFWPAKNLQWPLLADFELFIVCGGEMNVDEEQLYPWLRDEKQFLKQAIQQQKKMVGICLGGQLLAEVLGGRVQKHPAWEVGWHEVDISGVKLMVFEYHGYSFSLPPDAQQIATNSQCQEQAFNFNSQVLGCQFHPEVSQEMATYFAQDSELPTTGYSQSSSQILSGISLYQPTLQKWYFQELDKLTNPSKSRQ